MAVSAASTTFPWSNSSTPLGAGTWLATELDDGGDQLFGLGDLGCGCPELGYFGLFEMQTLRLPLGLGIERDLYFEGMFPLSIYAEAARRAGRIVFDKSLLLAAAESLREDS